MENLPNSVGSHSAIVRRGMNTFPTREDRYWSIQGNADRIVIDVYDFPEFKSQWDAFAQQINDLSIADQSDDAGNSPAQTNR